MLYQELPPIDSSPLDGWGRWLAPTLIAAAALTVALLLLLLNEPLLAGAALVAGLAGAAFARARAEPRQQRSEPLLVGPDYTLLGSALALSSDPVALTTAEGSLLLVNAAYRDRFGGARQPLQLGADEESREGLKVAQGMALRDGAGCAAGIETPAGATPVEVDRVGTHNDLLLWRFVKPATPDPVTVAANRMRGRAGDLLGRAGVLAAFVDPQGNIIACNRLFRMRALERDVEEETPRLTDLVSRIGHGPARLRPQSSASAASASRA